jgi:type IV secretory pathway VirJ component
MANDSDTTVTLVPGATAETGKAAETSNREFAPSLTAIASPANSIAFGKSLSSTDHVLTDMDIDIFTRRRQRGIDSNEQHTPLQRSDNRLFYAIGNVETMAENDRKPTAHQLSEVQIAARDFAKNLAVYTAKAEANPNTLVPGEDLKMEALHQVLKAIEKGAETSRNIDYGAAIQPLDTPQGPAADANTKRR